VTLTAEAYPASNSAFIYVSDVAEGTPAEEAGFLVEDIIQSVDGTPITSTRQLITLVRASQGQPLTVTVGRPFESVDITVTPEADDTGTVRIGLAVQDLTPSIIGATVADLDVNQEIGLIDTSSPPASQQIILDLLTIQPEFTIESGGADGAGGTWIIRFSAVAPGETTLTLHYASTFDENPEPVETFQINIVIDGGDNGENAAAQTLTDQDSGTAITLAAGDTLRIELAANETTGYFWVLDESLDQSILQQVGESEYVGEPDPAPGSGGTDIWTFEAVGAGTTTLTLNLERLNDTNPETAQTFQITVKVR